MLSAILLAVKNERLYIENHRQKRKRVKKRTYIARGGILLGAEGAFYTQAAQQGAAGGVTAAAAE